MPLRLAAVAAAAAAAAAAAPAAPPPVAIFPSVSSPAQHPRFDTTQTRPTTWAVLGNATHFAALRGFTQTANHTIVDYEATLAQYAPLGDVIWPVYATAFAPNAAEVLAYMADNGFLVTDLWGYVPGSGDDVDEMWVQFTPPPSFLAEAQALLGERWLGFDVGEQDGRYIGAYADNHAPLGAPPAQQRLFFEEHFQRMYAQLGGKVAALQSLTFAHAMAQAGVFTVVGCEAAQGLPSALFFYATARGAGKQYGLLWFGNVSVYNRFGYKTYSSSSGTRTDGAPFATEGPARRPRDPGAAAPALSTPGPGRTFVCQGQGGPTCGTSLSLMAKLMAAQLFYNSGYISFESSWFSAGSTLSPIGELQAGIKSWLATHGPPGTHLATLALVLDHAAGFTAPRHLYSDDVFRAWGNLPFSVARGDFLADGILRVVWPGYQDSSYFHDETGFSSPTPFGDALDVLLSDAPAWLLRRYDTLLLASTPRTEPGLLRRKLSAALAAGTNVVAWAGALGALSGGGLPGYCSIAEAAFAGAWTGRCAPLVAGTVTVLRDDGTFFANVTDKGFSACSLDCSTDAGATATVVAWAAAAAGPVPVAWRVTSSSAGGAGEMLIFAAPFGISSGAPLPAPDPGVDASLGSPFPLLQHVQTTLGLRLAARAPFSVPGLTFVAARADGADNADGTHNFTLLVSNPTLAQQPLAISSSVGAVEGIAELPIVPAAIYSAVGYLPDGYEDSDLGNSTANAIAGADTRAFRLAVRESAGAVRVLPTDAPPARPRNFALNVRALEGLGLGARSLPALVTSFPSLPQFFDLIVVDWRYLAERETAALVAEAAAPRQVGVGGIVDFDSGLGLFPALRLINNSASEYAFSLGAIGGVLAKAAAMGWRHAALSLHRTPENNMDPGEAVREMGLTLAALAASAQALNITLHLREVAKSPVGGVNASAAWLAAMPGASLRVMPNTAAMLSRSEWLDDMAAAVRGGVVPGAGDVVIVGASCVGRDFGGRAFADSLPLSAGCDAQAQAQAAALIATACSVGSCLGRAATTAGSGGGGGGGGHGGGTSEVVLVVDAFIGAEALSGGGGGGGGGGGDVGAGAALDLAYEEAQWLLDAAGAAAA